MTRDEVKLIIRTMTEAYPNYHPGNLSNTVDIWASILEDENAADVALGLKRYIKTNTSGFAPSPGQILAMIPKNDLPELEAWALVWKAIQNSNYHAEEEFAALPETIQKAVGSASLLRSWAGTDEENAQTVIQSHFLKAYRTTVKRSEVDRIQIGANNNNLLEGGKDGEEA